MAQPSGPAAAFGIVNAESIAEAIQACHVTLEESRLQLAPLARLISDDDSDGDHHGGTAARNGDGIGAGDGGSRANSLQGRFTDGRLVGEFAGEIERVFGSVDALTVRLADGGLYPPPDLGGGNGDGNDDGRGEDGVYLLMASNCISKCADFVGQNFLALLDAESLDGPAGPLDDRGGTADDAEDGAIQIQLCMARLAELTLRTIQINATIEPSHADDLDEHDEEMITPHTIVEAYSQYQRRCLRARSKPAISSVAELRRVASSQSCYVSDILEAERRRQQAEVGLDDEGDGHEDGDGNGMDGTAASRGQPHAQSITVILGEASSLIQPLAAWRDAISPHQPRFEDENDVGSMLRQLCQESVEMLNGEAQTLAVTVASWFGLDQRGVATLERDNASGTDATKSDLLSIESSLEEMAFMCQVISRYCLFSEQTVARDGADDRDSELQNLLTEQSLHYSTLETRLATLQFNQAISLASPQLIELGRPTLKVPSIVEDAHFVCVRAIERAAGTRSERAVWTVGHWVCETWGVDGSEGMMSGDGGVKGVCRALMEGVGCAGVVLGEDANHNDRSEAVQTSSKVENAFAAALLEAVGDDMDHREKNGGSNPGSGHNSAPASGGLSTFFGRGDRGQSLQSRIDAEMCALNGISAAGTACSALSGLFEDLVEEKLQEESMAKGSVEAPVKPSSMLTFARDELASHSRSYHNLLQQRVRTLVADLCGGDDIFDCDGQLCLQNLRLFIEKEIYNLDSSSFRTQEEEDRLEAEMIGPIRRSRIFEEIGKDKCDAAVVLQMSEAMSWKSAEIVLQVLFQGNLHFNEWGAMLLSKQVRMLQNIYCGPILDSAGSNGTKSGTASILAQFERINQAVSILQLEKPSDWLAFAYKVGDSNMTNLTADEIQKIMSLRLDFSEEAIARVCMQIK